MRKRPCDLRIQRQRQISALVERQLVDAKAVAAHQVVRLIEAVLAHRRRGAHVFHWRVADRPEGTELGVVDAATRVELGDLADDRSVAIGRRPDDKLHRHPGHATRPERVRRQPIRLLGTGVIYERPRLLECSERRREALIGRDTR